jgi:hypothetical protein
MAGMTERLQFLITANPDSAISAFKKVGDTADKELGRADDRTKKLGGNLTKFGAGAVAASAIAIGALFKLSGTFSDLALDVEKASLQTGLATEDFSRWAEVAGDVNIPLETLSGLIVKQNLNMEKSPALLEKWNLEIIKNKDGTTDVNATLLNNIALYQALKDPVDKAAFAQQVWGKSGKDAVELFNMPLPELKKNLDAVSDAKIITPEEIQKAKDFRSSMDSLKDSFEDIALEIGQGAAPIIGGLADIVGTAVGYFTDFNELTDGTAGKLLAIAAVGAGAAGGIALIAGKVIGLVGNFKDAVSAIKVFAAANTGMSLALGGITGVIALATIGYSVYNGRKEEATARTKDLSAALLGEKSAQNEALAALASSDDQVKRYLETASSLGLTVDDITQYVKDGTGKVAEYSSAWSEAKKEQGTYPELQAFAKFLNIDLSKGGWDTASAAARDFTLQSRDLREGELETQATIKLTTSLTEEQADATDDSTQSVKDNKNAVDDIKKAQEKYAAALEATKQKTSELYDLQRSLLDGTIDYEEQVDATEDAVASYNVVCADSASTMEDVDDASRDAFKAINDQATSYATLNGAALNSKEGVNRQIESLQTQASTLAPGSPLRSRIEQYIGRLQAIPSNVSTLLTLKSHLIGFGVDGSIVGAKGGYAAGTSYNAAAGVYDVGEQGRERVYLPRGAKVKTAAETKREDARSGGGTPVVNNYVTNVNMPPGSAETYLRNQREAFRRGLDR